jgi:outer membrane receptor protein involved in Fe transport
LKRLTIGGGVNYRGDEVIYNDPTTHANVMGSPYYLLEGMLGYKFKMFKTDVKLQLNVNNLLNNQNKQILAGGLTPTVTPAGTAIPGAAPYLAEFTYYLPPRSYNISARFDF